MFEIIFIKMLINKTLRATAMFLLTVCRYANLYVVYEQNAVLLVENVNEDYPNLNISLIFNNRNVIYLQFVGVFGVLYGIMCLLY